VKGLQLSGATKPAGEEGVGRRRDSGPLSPRRGLLAQKEDQTVLVRQ